MKRLQRNLVWFGFVVFTFVTIAVAWYEGFIGYLQQRDITYLSFVTIMGYALASSLLGVRAISRDKVDLDGYWFLSDMFLNIGLVGTVIGLLYVFHGFDHLPSSLTLEQLKPLMTNIGVGTSTSLLTTLVGLVASIFMKTQLWILER